MDTQTYSDDAKAVERRKYPRTFMDGDIRIYCGLKPGAYSLRFCDISKGGAFIKTPFVPKLGEMVTYELLDRYFQIVMSGVAEVVWVKSDRNGHDCGFGIRFAHELDDHTFARVESRELVDQ